MGCWDELESRSRQTKNQRDYTPKLSYSESLIPAAKRLDSCLWRELCKNKVATKAESKAPSWDCVGLHGGVISLHSQSKTLDLQHPKATMLWPWGPASTTSWRWSMGTQQKGNIYSNLPWVTHVMQLMQLVGYSTLYCWCKFSCSMVCYVQWRKIGVFGNKLVQNFYQCQTYATTGRSLEAFRDGGFIENPQLTQLSLEHSLNLTNSFGMKHSSMSGESKLILCTSQLLYEIAVSRVYPDFPDYCSDQLSRCHAEGCGCRGSHHQGREVHHRFWPKRRCLHQRVHHESSSICVLCRNFKDRDIDDVERIWVLFFGDCAPPLRMENEGSGPRIYMLVIVTRLCQILKLIRLNVGRDAWSSLPVRSENWQLCWPQVGAIEWERHWKLSKSVANQSQCVLFWFVLWEHKHTWINLHIQCVFPSFSGASGPTAWARASLPWESSRLSIRALDRWSVAVAWLAFEVLRCVISKDDYVAFARKTSMFIDPESTKGNCNELWAWECCESPEWQQIKDSAIESTCANVRNPACQCSRCKTCFPKAPTTLTRLVTQTKNRSLLYVDYDCTRLYPTDFERCADKHAVATWLEKGGPARHVMRQARIFRRFHQTVWVHFKGR